VEPTTFHAAAWGQLRYFWSRLSAARLPEVLGSKAPLLAPLQRGLPGGYKFTAIKDLADELEWAKARRLDPSSYQETIEAMGRTPPIPGDLFAGVFRRYERAKERAGRIDFEDMLVRMLEGFESRADVAEEFRGRYRWFSVDEYQDTNPLQQALLEAWLGDRRDLAVVGDEDQTIYTFTGATSEYLTGFARRFPEARVVRLEDNYRSSPEVLALANRLLAATPGRGPGRGQGAGRPPALGPRADRGRLRERRARGRGPGRRGHPPGPGRGRHRRDRRAGPDQRPDPAAGGGAGRGRHPLPGPGRAVLPPHRGAARPRGAALAQRPGHRRRPGRRPGGDLVRAVRVPPRRGARRRGGPPAPRQPGHPPRHRRAAGGPARRLRRWRRGGRRRRGRDGAVPGGGGAARGPGGRGDRGWGEPAHLPPGQGAGVRRGAAAGAGGGSAADPPGQHAGGGGRGAAAAVRGADPGAGPSVAVVGGPAGRAVGPRAAPQAVAVPGRSGPPGRLPGAAPGGGVRDDPGRPGQRPGRGPP